MRPMDRQEKLRLWIFGLCAALLSAASGFAFLCYLGQGIVVGDLYGSRGRDADIAYARRWAMYWLLASVFCLGVSSVASALAARVYEEASRLPRFFARLALGILLSAALAGTFSVIFSWIVTTSHRSVVR